MERKERKEKMYKGGEGEEGEEGEDCDKGETKYRSLCRNTYRHRRYEERSWQYERMVDELVIYTHCRKRVNHSSA